MNSFEYEIALAKLKASVVHVLQVNQGQADRVVVVCTYDDFSGIDCSVEMHQSGKPVEGRSI